VSPQRRSALVSVAAAAVLVLLKLTVGLATHSLGFVSEAAHSGTDLVAALLTFFAIRVAARPADVTHQFGHGKAEHLSALAEAMFLVAAALLIAARAVQRLTGNAHSHVDVTWYALVVIVLVIAIDASRATVSWRTAQRYGSAALASNAFHFGGDLIGSVAVLVGLLVARHGHQNGDPIAAVFVSCLVLVGAARLIKVNVDVLMDRAPAAAEAAALTAIGEMRPAVEVRRLRMRQAGNRQFADVVIAVPAGAAVGQGHTAASAVEEAVARALPNADVVVHVEPLEAASLRERVHAAAVAVPRVREVHNIALVDVDERTELSLHVKLPGDLSLDDAHAVAEELEGAICAAIPEIAGVQTHIEPLAEASEATEVEVDAEELVRRVVREALGADPRELRFLRTDAGLVAFLTLGLDGTSRLDAAHARASEIEERIRAARPDIADVIVHTEP
jgi:cation diffusion facilitator family transporter